jgi:myo-inositol-1(or 4)-monophosphatase
VPPPPAAPPRPAHDADDPAWRGALDATLRDVAARAASFIAAHAERRGELDWEHKGPADFVSVVDRGAEDLVRAALLSAYPDAAFLGEESYDPGAPLGDGLAFVVDPLDGTTNFLHGFPWYAVSIGATLGGELVAGVVHNAATGEVFSATRGDGARRRAAPGAAAERIHVSKISDPARALVGTGFPFKELRHLDAFLRQFAAVTRATAGVRRAGAAALDLCDVACGRFEAFWELTLAPWDVAAGMLIAREAGAVVTTIDGAEARVAHTTVCAGGPAMHAWLLATLAAA